MELTSKLAKIQRELKAPKSQYNDFGKYKYRNCEDILEAVKPLLGECVCTVTDDLLLIGDRYYVKATAALLDMGSKDVITCTAYAREPETKKGMDESQITGSASSYARKYALNGLFLIDDTKDADSMDNRAKQETPKQAPKSTAQPAKTGQVAPEPATIKQLQLIQIEMKNRGHEREEILKLLSGFVGRELASSKELTKQEASEWLSLHVKEAASAVN